MGTKTCTHRQKDLINHKPTKCRQFHDRSCILSRTVEKEPSCCGGVAEWLNAAVLKTVERASVPGVRIPPPPPGLDISQKLLSNKFMQLRAILAHPKTLGPNFAAQFAAHFAAHFAAQKDSECLSANAPVHIT